MGSKAPLVDIAKEKIIDFDTEVMTIPQFDPSNPKMISQGPSVCVFNKSDSDVVLASWLFAQFLITNEVQIAYSETEGYVPVTLKAQNAAEYKEYLEAEGADSDLHYDVKIKAAKLLMDNTANTFVTPVFNGSTSVRDAAGQLIENVTKAVRRKKTVDDKFIDATYEEVKSLYHLDSGTSGAGGGKKSLGPLPAASKALIGTLIFAWVVIGFFTVKDKFKKEK